MQRNTYCLVAAILILAGDPVPSASQPPPADEYGTKCRNCTVTDSAGNRIPGKEGYDHREFGVNNMGCFPNIPNCVSCASLTSHAAEQSQVSELVQGASYAQVAAIAIKHGDQLLVSPERGIIAVRADTPCDPKAIAVVVFVQENHARRYKELGVQLLESFLSADR